MLLNGSRSLLSLSKSWLLSGMHRSLYSLTSMADTNFLSFEFVPSNLSPSGRIFCKMLSRDEKSLLIAETDKLSSGNISFSTQIAIVKFIKSYYLADDPKALEMILSLYFLLNSVPCEEKINLSGTYLHFHVCRSFILNLPRPLILPVYLLIVEICRTLTSEPNLSVKDLSNLLLGNHSMSSFSIHSDNLLTKKKIIEIFKLTLKQVDLFSKFCIVLHDTFITTGSLLEFYSLSLLFQRVAFYYALNKSEINNSISWMHSASKIASCISYGSNCDSHNSILIPPLLDAIGLLQQTIPILSSREKDHYSCGYSGIQIYGLTQQNLILLYNSALIQFLKSHSFSQGRALFEFIKGGVADVKLDEKGHPSIASPCRPNVETYKILFSLYMNQSEISGNIKDSLIILYSGLEYLSYPLELCIHAAKILFTSRCLEDAKALYLRVRSSSLEVSRHIKFENIYLSCLSMFRAVNNYERQAVRDISSLLLSHTGKTVVHSSNSSLLVGLLYRFKRRDLADYINHLPITLLSDCPFFFSYVLKLLIIDASHRTMLFSLLNDRFKIFDGYPEGSSLVDYRSGYISCLFSRNHPEIAALLYYWEMDGFVKFLSNTENCIQTFPLGDKSLASNVDKSSAKTIRSQPVLKPFSHYYHIRILYIEENSEGIVKYFLYFSTKYDKSSTSYSWISNRTIDMLVWAFSMEHEWKHLCQLLIYFSNFGDGGFSPDHLALSGGSLLESGESLERGSAKSQKDPFSNVRAFIPPPFIENRYSLMVPCLYKEFKSQIDAYPGNFSPVSTLYFNIENTDSDISLSASEVSMTNRFLDKYITTKNVREAVLSNQAAFLELDDNVQMYLRSILGIPTIFLDFYDRMISHHNNLYAYLIN